MEASKLAKLQTKQFKKMTPDGLFTLTIRHDDQCGNRHNTFTITGEIGDHLWGMLHDEAREYFPELSHLLKWHLCSTDGPMHYIANTLYWVGRGRLDHARSSAIWPDATISELRSEDKLERRLPGLLKEFKRAVESVGFTY
jgi:hypothetical protein